uniref:Uncharacterized protein n=1 Tax=Arundo donax TaxID=35708 RepID=A0A0A9GS56_ARUDO
MQQDLFSPLTNLSFYPMFVISMSSSKCLLKFVQGLKEDFAITIY